MMPDDDDYDPRPDYDPPTPTVAKKEHECDECGNRYDCEWKGDGPCPKTVDGEKLCPDCFWAAYGGCS